MSSALSGLVGGLANSPLGNMPGLMINAQNLAMQKKNMEMVEQDRAATQEFQSALSSALTENPNLNFKQAGQIALQHGRVAEAAQFQSMHSNQQQINLQWAQHNLVADDYDFNKKAKTREGVGRKMLAAFTGDPTQNQHQLTRLIKKNSDLISQELALEPHRKAVGAEYVNIGGEDMWSITIENSKTGTTGVMTQDGTASPQDSVVLLSKDELQSYLVEMANIKSSGGKVYSIQGDHLLNEETGEVTLLPASPQDNIKFVNDHINNLVDDVGQLGAAGDINKYKARLSELNSTMFSEGYAVQDVMSAVDQLARISTTENEYVKALDEAKSAEDYDRAMRRFLSYVTPFEDTPAGASQTTPPANASQGGQPPAGATPLAATPPVASPVNAVPQGGPPLPPQTAAQIPPPPPAGAAPVASPVNAVPQGGPPPPPPAAAQSAPVAAPLAATPPVPTGNLLEVLSATAPPTAAGPAGPLRADGRPDQSLPAPTLVPSVLAALSAAAPPTSPGPSGAPPVAPTLDPATATALASQSPYAQGIDRPPARAGDLSESLYPAVPGSLPTASALAPPSAPPVPGAPNNALSDRFPETPLSAQQSSGNPAERVETAKKQFQDIDLDATNLSSGMIERAVKAAEETLTSAEKVRFKSQIDKIKKARGSINIRKAVNELGDNIPPQFVETMVGLFRRAQVNRESPAAAESFSIPTFDPAVVSSLSSQASSRLSQSPYAQGIDRSPARAGDLSEVIYPTIEGSGSLPTASALAPPSAPPVPGAPNNALSDRFPENALSLQGPPATPAERLETAKRQFEDIISFDNKDLSGGVLENAVDTAANISLTSADQIRFKSQIDKIKMAKSDASIKRAIKELKQNLPPEFVETLVGLVMRIKEK